MKSYQKTQFLFSGVQDFMRRYIPPQAFFLSQIRKDWERIVGRNIAGHSFPANLRAGILSVNVDDSIWIQELSLQKDSLREHILDFFKDSRLSGVFTTLRFRNGEVARNNTSQARKLSLSLDKDTRQKIDETLSPIEDKELRESLRKYLIQSSLK
jgi:hypothetical protein